MQADDEARRRRLAWLVRMSIILTVAGTGGWVVWELDKARRAQNCIESGDRRCRIIDTR